VKMKKYIEYAIEYAIKTNKSLKNACEEKNLKYAIICNIPKPCL